MPAEVFPTRVPVAWFRQPSPASPRQCKPIHTAANARQQRTRVVRRNGPKRSQGMRFEGWPILMHDYPKWSSPRPTSKALSRPHAVKEPRNTRKTRKPEGKFKLITLATAREVQRTPFNSKQFPRFV